jgi:hypothetical protein
MGCLVLTSLKEPRPEWCDLYVAAVRMMPRPVPGWEWNEQIRELGPPPELHAKRRQWEAEGEWPKRWREYETAFREWLTEERCARLLDDLEKRLLAGQKIALGCWCRTPIFCHLSLIGLEMEDRGLQVIFA